MHTLGFPKQKTLQNGRYQLLARLGQGGVAMVWRVLDTRFDIERAIKILVVEPEFIVPNSTETEAKQNNSMMRFKREAKLMMQLHHNNIVTVYDYFEEDGNLHIVMEKCVGSLDTWVRAKGMMPVGLAVNVIIHVLKALQKAHFFEVVHRDIKPHNILISQDGEIKLADFGLAMTAFASQSITKTNALLGSIQFMSPEQRNDPTTVEKRADIYSVAVSLVWMLEGKTIGDLYVDDTIEQLRKKYPKDVVDVIAKAGKRKPEERYSSAKEMLDALEAIYPTLPKHSETLFGIELQEISIDDLNQYFDSKATLNSQSVSQEVQLPRSFYWAISIVVLLLFIVTGLVASNFTKPITETKQVSQNIVVEYPKCDNYIGSLNQVVREGPKEMRASRLFDVDQDGYLDVLFSHAMGKVISIYWGDQEGSFAERQDIENMRTDFAPVVMDIDNDGVMDIIGMHYDTNKISISKGLGERQFRGLNMEGRDFMLQGPGPIRGEPHDINQDGYDDLVFSSEYGKTEQRLFVRLNGKRGLDYEILDLPGVEEEPLGWHKDIAQYPGTIHIGVAEPAVYWIEDNALWKQKIRPNLMMEAKEKLFSNTKGMHIRDIETLGTDKDYLFIQSEKGLLQWSEGTEPCLLFEGGFHSNNSFRGLSVGDWNSDGYLDLIFGETCRRCTSNHVVGLGQP